MLGTHNKLKLAALAAVCTLALPAAPRAEEAVRIGVALPLSGPNAQFGQNARRGIELAVETINAAGGIASLNGAKVEAVFADVPSPTAAGAATQRLISQDGVVGMVGSFVSSTTLAVSEATERAGIPMITGAFADEITGRGYKYIFQVAPTGTAFGRAQFDYARAIAETAGITLSKVAILYEDTAYGTAQAAGLRAAAKAAGVPVVLDEGYPLGITDATPLVNKLRTSGAEIVFPVSYLNDSLLIIRAMRQQRMEIPAVGGAAGYVIPDFQKGLGPYAEGVFSVAPTSYDLAPELAARFKEKYGQFMPQEAMTYGASFEILAAAADAAGSRDPEKIRDHVAASTYCKGFAAALPEGCPRFNANGLSETAVPVFVQWRGADLVTVYPPAVAKQKPRWMGQDLN